MNRASPSASQPAWYVPRRATRADDSSSTKPLSQWRDLDAYVLLGDPGAGKTEALEAEAAALGTSVVRAADFVIGVAPECQGTRTYFIDAIDEQADGHAILSKLRERLITMGRPRIRLSCREIDWKGQVHAEDFSVVAPSGEISVLHLDPLSDEDIRSILIARLDGPSKVERFLEEVGTKGIDEWLRNPMLLNLLIEANAGKVWGSTKRDLYEAACKKFAGEHDQRRKRTSSSGQLEQTLHDAGLLSALLLLSNKSFVSEDDADGGLQILELPSDLKLHDARAALSTKLFTTRAGRSTWLHKTIAEYLAARSIAELIKTDKVPLGRVLALIQGIDGRPVAALRGLFAWLTVHRVADRQRMIAIDPLGVVINGDVGAFTTSERREVLDRLRNEAVADPWFRIDNWVSHPFGPLAMTDLEPEFQDFLSAPVESSGDQVFMNCVLDALLHGQRMPALAVHLERLILDPGADHSIRWRAYDAWKHTAGFEPSKAQAWLDKLEARSRDWVDREVAFHILEDLYPKYIGPRDVFAYKRPPMHKNVIGSEFRFWSDALLRLSRAEHIADLADAWLAAQPKSDERDHKSDQLSSDMLARVLDCEGDRSSTQRLHDWLGMCLDDHAFSRLTGEETGRKIRAWLEHRPERMKAIVEYAYPLVAAAGGERRRNIFWAEQRLHGARRPHDWLRWMLSVAETTDDEAMAEDCFSEVAVIVTRPYGDWDIPSLEDIESWVSRNAAKWPQAHEWLEKAWTSSLEDWRHKEVAHANEREQRTAEERAKRRRDLAPHVGALMKGAPSDAFLGRIAQVHEKNAFVDVVGDSPEQRVQDFLVDEGMATVHLALEAIDRVLSRVDLPKVEDILALNRRSEFHWIRPAALLAAQRAHEGSSDGVLGWPVALAQKLFAFYLTDGTGNTPAWFDILVEKRAADVASIYVEYAGGRLKHGGNIAITALDQLSRHDKFVQLARLVLPQLLLAFQSKASKEARHNLDRYLLPALPLLDPGVSRAIVKKKLAAKGMDPMQRVSWLVANLRYGDESSGPALVKWIGGNPRRVDAFAESLDEQRITVRHSSNLEPRTLAKLFELLAPGSNPSWGESVDTSRTDTTHSLLHAIAAADRYNIARDELRRLASVPALANWEDAIRGAMHSQVAHARERSYAAPSPREVALALSNKAPTGPADLQALVVESLKQIEQKFRGDSAYLLLWLWKDDKSRPRDENSCRDVLKGHLETRLNDLGVAVEPEVQAAAKKCMDLRATVNVNGKEWRLPIEAKVEANPKLWTAWHDQLQRLYMNDPRSGGYGIYLVFWFGLRPRSSLEGELPTSSEHLRTLLEARIPAPDRARLKVVVLDFSIPLHDKASPGTAATSRSLHAQGAGGLERGTDGSKLAGARSLTTQKQPTPTRRRTVDPAA